MVTVEEITKRFGATVALQGVSFRVGHREVLGFLGPNAAGKTTTMRILTGFLPPDGGRVEVGGFVIPGQSIEVRRQIGYLPEHIALYREMTVRGMLDYLAALRDVPARRRASAVDAVIERCGLGQVQGKVVGELSRGYRQRCGLAQALVHDPDVLVLDEPTVGLDPKQIHEVRTLITEVGRERTVLLSSHILPEVQATCDRVVIIHRGRIVAEDTTEGLAACAQGDLTLRLVVRGEAPTVRDLVGAIPEARILDGPTQEGELVRLELRVGHHPSLRERVARHIVGAGLGLLEMTPLRASLEDVFLQLTREESE